MQPAHSDLICTSRKATQGISTYCTATCYQSNGANVTINSLTTCYCEVTATSQPHRLKHSFRSTQRLCTTGTWVRVASQPGHLLLEKSSASPCWPCLHRGLHQCVDGAATESREVALHPLQVIWARPSSSRRLPQPTTSLSRMPPPHSKLQAGPRAGASSTPYITSSCRGLAGASLVARMRLKLCLLGKYHLVLLLRGG